jgi:hypothetical protein
MTIQTNYNLQVVVNNVPINVKPNSLKYKSGQGEDMLEAFTTGGRNVEMAHSKNVETFVAEISFDMPEDAPTNDLIIEWKGNNPFNQILLVNPDTNFTLTFNSATLANDPEHNPTSDGVVTVEWKAAPAL